MKGIFTFSAVIIITVQSIAQIAFNSPHTGFSTENSKREINKSKPIMYNSLGYNIILNPDQKDIIIGGSSIAYKKWGFCLSYKLGIKNFMLPENGDRGEITYDNIIENKWTITDKTQRASVFMVSGCIAIPITKKIPIYFGSGTTYFREFFQYVDPADSSLKWNVHPDKTKFEMNYTAGIFIPVIGRFLLNLQYDYNPQSIFVGIVIRDKLAYVDMDDW